MKPCTNCDASLSDDAMFCTKCGTPVPAGHEQQAPPPAEGTSRLKISGLGGRSTSPPPPSEAPPGATASTTEAPPATSVLYKGDDAPERLLNGFVNRRQPARAERAGDPISTETNLAHRSKRETPVIAFGTGIPMSSSIVGATSQMRPPARSLRSRSFSLT